MCKFDNILVISPGRKVIKIDEDSMVDFCSKSGCNCWFICQLGLSGMKFKCLKLYNAFKESKVARKYIQYGRKYSSKRALRRYLNV